MHPTTRSHRYAFQILRYCGSPWKGVQKLCEPASEMESFFFASPTGNLGPWRLRFSLLFVRDTRQQ